MHCTNCGKPILEGANFCIGCGCKVQPAAVQPEQKTQVTAPIPVNYGQNIPEQPLPQPFEHHPEKKGSLKAPLIVLAVLSVVGLILYFLFPMSGTSSADHSVHSGSDTPWFEILSGSLYFYEESYAGSQELTVPETVNGKTVTSIGEFCFSDCDDLTTVILPQTVERIEYLAFYDCDSLRGIFIPEGVTEIGDEAFADCDALEAISLPSTLESLNGEVFNDCYKLKHIFFSGTKEQWKDIYEGKTDSPAFVHCTDGKLPTG